MKILKAVFVFCISAAIVCGQVSPTFAAARYMKKAYGKSQSRQALVLLTAAQYKDIITKRKDLARAFDKAKKNVTAAKVSHRDAMWLMALSKQTAGDMRGGAVALVTLLPFIVIAVPIVYTYATGRDFIADYPAAGFIVCILGAFWVPSLQASCQALMAPRGTVSVRPTAR